MARVRVRCSRPNCKQMAPCSLHPRGWASSKSPPLPSNWSQLRKIVKARKNCAVCGMPGTEVDHIVNRAAGGDDSLQNLQLLCYDHHKLKTQQESKRGNKRGNR